MKDPLAMELVIAHTLFARMRGLLGTDASWGEGNTALMLIPCNSIHTFGMRYAIDVAFIDRKGVVIRSEKNVAPDNILKSRRAIAVLERPSSTAPWPEEGSRSLWGYG